MIMMIIFLIPNTCLIQHVHARACACMFYLVDGLYRRAELNKHAHCLRVPAIARPQQRCQTVYLPALARHYSTEVIWIT